MQQLYRKEAQRFDQPVEVVKIKREAIKIFHNDHADGDSAIYNLVKKMLEWHNAHLQAAVREVEPKIEIKAKLEALDKLAMGAGEYHNDPYEYVVPLRYIREYRASLNKLDLSQPVFKEEQSQTKRTVRCAHSEDISKCPPCWFEFTESEDE